MDVSTTIAPQVPAGTVLDFAGSSAPTGYLTCDGSLISRTTYARLFDAIGTTWGAGDGSTTFKLPDLRGRATIGVGTGSGLTARTLAASGGEETHQLTSAEMPSHTHTQNSHNHTQDAHSHTGVTRIGTSAYQVFGGSYTAGTNPAVGTGNNTSQTTDATTATNQATTATNQSTGGDGYHNNMQPYAALNKIIKY